MYELADPVEFLNSCDNVSYLNDMLKNINEEIKSITKQKENPSPLVYSFANKMKMTVNEVFDRRLRPLNYQRIVCENRIKELSLQT